MAGGVIFEDNSGQAKSAFKAAALRGLEAIGLSAEGHAKQALTDQGAVDTGRLRNSVSHATEAEEMAEYIGSNVEYALPVEVGTRKMAARPYLRPAATEHTAEYKALMENSLRNA